MNVDRQLIFNIAPWLFNIDSLNGQIGFSVHLWKIVVNSCQVHVFESIVWTFYLILGDKVPLWQDLTEIAFHKSTCSGIAVVNAGFFCNDVEGVSGTR